MSKEHTGVLLIIAAILQTAKGREILHSVRKGNFKKDWQVQDWILLVETLLEWEAFLKKDKIEIRLAKRYDVLRSVVGKLPTFVGSYQGCCPNVV